MRKGDVLFVGPFMADLINRHINLPWAVELITVALIGGGYSTALAFLKSSVTRFDPGLSSMRDLLLLMLVPRSLGARSRWGHRLGVENRDKHMESK